MAQLVFSDTSNRQGIIQEIEWYTGLGDDAITGDTDLLKHFTRLINNWDGRLNAEILLADGKWQYDDQGHGDMPIATTNLVSGQQDYTVTTDDNTRQIWKVDRVDIKDSTGTWKQLKQIDQRQIEKGYSAYQSTDAEPKEFDWNGISLMLFPAPNYASAGGLKIIFRRESEPFSSTGDDSKAPGFASAFHYLLALGPSYDYAVAHGKQNLPILRQELEMGRKELRQFYSSRNSQDKPRLAIKQESTR